ncbi:cytoplasmic protein [Lentinula edodes]|uniref:Cytoplasmic protein n=1 Tax=Lentinula edodes TaxID=5353 RepID=A0A1Q3EC77_LENED|nr:cytoplasmic protein [Lentinula edodes]
MTSTSNSSAPSLIGSVFERKPSIPKPPSSSSQSRFTSTLNSKTGFPPVQHRSQKSSAFLKNIENGRRKPELSSERSTQVPSIVPQSATPGPGPSTIQSQNQKQNGVSSTDDWRSHTKHEKYWKDLDPAFAELGPDQVHVYPSAPSSPKKALLALPPPDEDSNAVSLGTFKGRMKPIDLEDATASQTQVEQVKEEAAETHVEEGTAEIQVEQVEEGTTEIQAEQIEKGTAETQVEQVEEGTAEYIRQKYFPSAPADNPDLAWMSSSLDPPSLEQTPDLRFDLNGTPIPSSKILSLPTHLGLHHHAEGTRAGYTLDDIFLLTRSTVRAQRAAMLEVLVGVTRWLRTSGTKDDVDVEAARKSLLNLPSPEGSGIPPLLKRILFSGLEALPERGAVGVRAMDVVWECVVGQTNVTEDLGDLEFESGGMEEGKTDEGVLITALPLADVLPQFLSLLFSPPDSDLGDERLSTSTFNQPEFQSLRTTPAQQQILSILTRLARYSNAYAETIVQEKGLIEGLLRVFIIPPATSTYASIPDLATVRLLTILASASRTNAEALCQKIGAGDVLLRFVVLSTNDDVLVEIMIFYTILARYGMYSRVAADAKEVWWKIGDHVVALSSSYSQSNMRLVRAYVGLIEAWLICATDPHRTTPSHELLWSQSCRGEDGYSG